MKRTAFLCLVFASLLLGACNPFAAAQDRRARRELEIKVATMEVRLQELEQANRELRDLVLLTRRDPSTPPPFDSSAPNPTSKVQCATNAAGGYVLSRKDLESALGDASALALQARIVPHFENGAARGFKLFSIRPGSLYTSCGVKNGDVVLSVNGFALNSPDKALEMYTKAKLAKRLEIAILRYGKAENLVIDITE